MTFARGDQTMFAIQFQIYPPGRDRRWIVRLGNSFYGAYLDKDQALLDAVDAAQDTVEAGLQAEVWFKDRSTTARVF
jgi:hypothetical protein